MDVCYVIPFLSCLSTVFLFSVSQSSSNKGASVKTVKRWICLQYCLHMCFISQGNKSYKSILAGFFFFVIFFNVFMSCRQKDNAPTVILYRIKMTVKMRTIIVLCDECKDKFDYNCDNASTEDISSLSSEHSTGKLTWCNDHSSCDWSLLGNYVWQPSLSSYTRLFVSQCNMYINYSLCE